MCSEHSLLTLIVSIICVLLSYIFSINFYGNIFRKNNTSGNNTPDSMSNKMKEVKIASIIAFTSFVFALHGMLVTSILHCANNDLWAVLEQATFFSEYTIGLHAIMYTFVARIKYTFVDSLSIFSYKPGTIKILMAAIILLFFQFVASLTIRGSLPHLTYIWATLLTLYLPFLVILYVVLIILLARKVIAMMKHKIRMFNHDHINNDNDNESGTNDVINITSIETVVRYTTLASVSFVSTFLTVIAALIYFAVVPNRNDFDSINAFCVVDVFVNAICTCLMFDFQFSNDFYHKFFGKHFHPWLRNVFIKRVIRQSKVELELSVENETEFKQLFEQPI